jgi:hypothetical protein
MILVLNVKNLHSSQAFDKSKIVVNKPADQPADEPQPGAGQFAVWGGCYDAMSKVAKAVEAKLK